MVGQLLLHRNLEKAEVKSMPFQVAADWVLFPGTGKQGSVAGSVFAFHFAEETDETKRELMPTTRQPFPRARQPFQASSGPL